MNMIHRQPPEHQEGQASGMMIIMTWMMMLMMLIMTRIIMKMIGNDGNDDKDNNDDFRAMATQAETLSWHAARWGLVSTPN